MKLLLVSIFTILSVAILAIQISSMGNTSKQKEAYNKCMIKHKYNARIRYDVISAIELHCQEIRNNTK